MRQNGQYAMICSHSSEHVQRLVILLRHSQQMGCVQHPRCVSDLQHSSASQKSLAQM